MTRKDAQVKAARLLELKAKIAEVKALEAEANELTAELAKYYEENEMITEYGITFCNGTYKESISLVSLKTGDVAIYKKLLKLGYIKESYSRPYFKVAKQH